MSSFEICFYQFAVRVLASTYCLCVSNYFALYRFFALKYVADSACIVLRVDQIREGLHYNPYFPGGAIAMPKMLIDGAVEYEDVSPATESQMGKDVVTFLSWAAEPEMEERKLMGFKWIFVLSLALLQAAYYRRMRWSVLKSHVYTTKMFQLLLAAYSTISIQDASLFLGMNEDDATNLKVVSYTPCRALNLSHGMF
ncbi:hypothetical protein TEA_003464 [Camellia sinensis var. sinensis]|uniref:Cytochrome c domain-containing protein n=1 Tax=Camellia sinensis var. sinensis TaxID=542762 RepID=A0A4S4DXP7_CAMSN|nr:hypothetical protein TEA_003464 [Camellia sinensis var. sinensis]